MNKNNYTYKIVILINNYNLIQIKSIQLPLHPLNGVGGDLKMASF